MRVIMRLDDETVFRYATECNYLIWWSPAAGAVVREYKMAQYLEKGDMRSAVAHRSQNADVALRSFQRAT
jgi:hypothetical protein